MTRMNSLFAFYTTVDTPVPPASTDYYHPTPGVQGIGLVGS